MDEQKNYMISFTECKANDTAFPWVSGTMAATAVAGSKQVVIAPVYTAGDETLLTANGFAAASDGIWELYIGSYRYGVVSNFYTMISKNDVPTDSQDGCVIATRHMSHRVSSDINAVVNLEKDDYLYSVVWSDTTAASTTVAGTPFVFRRVA